MRKGIVLQISNDRCLLRQKHKNFPTKGKKFSKNFSTGENFIRFYDARRNCYDYDPAKVRQPFVIVPPLCFDKAFRRSRRLSRSRQQQQQRNAACRVYVCVYARGHLLIIIWIGVFLQIFLVNFCEILFLRASKFRNTKFLKVKEKNNK